MRAVADHLLGNGGMQAHDARALLQMLESGEGLTSAEAWRMARGAYLVFVLGALKEVSRPCFLIFAFLSSCLK